ncbi:MAG TPA: hypothetical protein PLW83_00065 [Deltaproteobacteria bacterium]|nr:hypothetical protein [Deltaproteobacteria bacterium]
MKKTLPAIVAVLVISVLTGCAQIKAMGAGAGADKDAAQESRPTPRYLDFSDVLIPGELDRVPKECFILNGHGRLVVSGRVQAESLTQFFMTSMNTEGWVSLNQYKFQGSVKLFFKKPDRFATVLISEDPFSTKVEIWVVPQEKI